MSLDDELNAELESQGADFVCFVDLSQLTGEQNRQYPNAILFGIALSPGFLQEITTTPDYVQNRKLNNQLDEDEFQQKEFEADRIADHIAEFLKSKGFSAFSQSEKNLASAGVYDFHSHTTPLPHKTIARLAGLGWIGKNDLIITHNYGSAFSMSTVLTDAPLKTVSTECIKSLCGDCTSCIDNCPVNAIKGNSWAIGITRDEMVDVVKCNCCLQCLAYCPWTITYMKRAWQKFTIKGDE